MYKTMLSVLLLVAGFQQASAEDEICPDEVSIRQAIASYIDAFNKADAKAVAAHWSENGEFITPDGRIFQGRDALTQNFAGYFEKTKNVKIELDVLDIRFLSPGVAVEEGVARILVPKEQPHETEYVAVHVNTAQGWKMDSVKEQQLFEPQTHYEQLKVLEWMIGTWVDADQNGSVETTCQWTKNRNFMTRSFKVHVEDRITMEGTQVIGWDPIKKTIRSWMFDSAGGFGVGIWSQDENRWTVRTLQVLANGEKASAINIMTQIDENSYTFRSVGREVDGELLPSIEEVKVVRE